MEAESAEELLAAARALAFQTDDSVVRRIDAALALATEPGDVGRLQLALAIAAQGRGDASKPAAAAEQAIPYLLAAGDTALAAFCAAAAAVFLDQTNELERSIELAIDAMVLLEDVAMDDVESVRASIALSGFFARLSAFEPSIDYGRRAFAGAVELDGVPVDTVAFSYGYITAEGAHVAVDPAICAARMSASTLAAEWLIVNGTSPISREMLGPGLLAEVAIVAGTSVDLTTLAASEQMYGAVAPDLVAWHRLVRATLHLREGDPATAIELLDDAVPGLKASADNHCLVRALRQRADAKVAVSDPHGALDDMRELAELTRGWQIGQVGRLASQVARCADLERSSLQLRSHAADLAEGMDNDRTTGVRSRHWLEGRLLELEAIGGTGSITMFDIDHFKHVNDIHGHPVGDVVLARFGALLESAAGESCDVARYGGEEFVLIAVGADERSGHQLAERIRLTIATHDWESIADGISLTTSAGVAFGDLRAVRQMLIEADHALLDAKRWGRNRVGTASGTAAVELV